MEVETRKAFAPAIACGIHRKRILQYVCTKKRCNKRILCSDCILDHQTDARHILSIEDFIEQNTGFNLFHSEHKSVIQEYKGKLDESIQKISAVLDKLVLDLTAAVSTIKTKITLDSITNLNCLEEALKKFTFSRDQVLQNDVNSLPNLTEVKSQPELVIVVEDLIKKGENNRINLKDLQLQHQMIQSRFVDRDLTIEMTDHINNFGETIKKFLNAFPYEKDILSRAYAKFAFSKQLSDPRLQIKENGSRVEFKAGGEAELIDDIKSLDDKSIAYAFMDVDLSQYEMPLSWTIELKRKIKKPLFPTCVGVAQLNILSPQRIPTSWYGHGYGMSVVTSLSFVYTHDEDGLPENLLRRSESNEYQEVEDSEDEVGVGGLKVDGFSFGKDAVVKLTYDPAAKTLEFEHNGNHLVLRRVEPMGGLLLKPVVGLSCGHSARVKYV